MEHNNNLHECIVLKAKHSEKVSHVSIYDYKTDRVINTVLFHEGFNFDMEDSVYQSKVLYIEFYENTDSVCAIYDSDNTDKSNLLYDL